MVLYPQLLVPILLAAVLVFVASAMIHMVLRWHNADYGKLANEDEVGAAIRKGAPAPGQYILPHCTDPKLAATPEMTRKYEEGPVGMLWLRPPGALNLGPFLGKWFVYCVLVSALVAYLARISLSPGAEPLAVFRFVGTSAWLAPARLGNLHGSPLAIGPVHAHVFQLIPLHDAEDALLERDGPAALEAHLSRARVDPYDLARATSL